MPSAVWSGHLHFGLVALPVRLLVAARTKTTRFRHLYRKPIDADPSATSFASFSPDHLEQDSDPYDGIGKMRSTTEETDARHTEPHQYSTVRQVLQSERGEEIRPDEVIKGYEIAPNEFAVINPQEIKAADIETSDTIDLFHFVKASEVDPIYFERSYYVAPESGSEKVYALLLEANAERGVFRDCTNRDAPTRAHADSPAFGSCLAAHTMFYANEVRLAPQVELTTEFSNKELSMAAALIKGYEGEFDPTQFKTCIKNAYAKLLMRESVIASP